jgi:dTDP-4-dehydrorhamnose reductase
MILVLGSGDYLTAAFTRELRSRYQDFSCHDLSNHELRSFDALFELIRRLKPEFVLSTGFLADEAANSRCETSRSEAVFANVLLPQQIARVCVLTKTRWAHVITGPLYAGGKISLGSKIIVEPDLGKRSVLKLLRSNPEALHGFTEEDAPNYSEAGDTGFIARTQALVDDVLRQCEGGYIWRCQNMFDEQDDPRNYLSRLRQASNVPVSKTTLCHRADFACACIHLWQGQAPFGAYNLVNPGTVSQDVLKWNLRETLRSADQSVESSIPAPISSVLDGSKAASFGVRMRPVEVALDAAIAAWRPGTGAFRTPEPKTPDMWLPFSSPSPLQVQDWLRTA